MSAKCNIISKHHISIFEVFGLNSRQGIPQSPDNRIGDSSENGNNNSSPNLNMTDSANAESVDNSESCHSYDMFFIP